MVSATVQIFRDVIGVIGNIISGFLFLSPMPTFIQIMKKGSVEQFSPFPYLATLVNCMVWVMYGLPMVHPNTILVLTINAGGTALECFYIGIFLFYSDKEKRLKVYLVLLVELIFISLLLIVVLTLLHTTEKRSMVVGIICIVFNIMMYASPLFVMKLVITTKSVEYMPFFLSLASFGNGVAWFIYSFLPFDKYIAIPNGLGTLFSMAQLLLYACYYRSTQRIKKAKKQAAMEEVDLSEVIMSSDPKKIDTKVQDGHRGSEINGA
uniref:Bidirectional sugar transporter SWEET n=1 Tax=Litchi chinensis TaxID=151069 RepID=A0A6C0G8Z5_LITCN|nr:sugar efflux transporter 6 [Litchi chinensis]